MLFGTTLRSEMGQKRLKGDVRVEFGRPSTADIGRCAGQVSSVPISDSCGATIRILIQSLRRRLRAVSVTVQGPAP